MKQRITHGIVVEKRYTLAERFRTSVMRRPRTSGYMG